MKKIVLILTLLFSTKAFSQVYQLMNQYGYNVTRMSFDSTLQIPTVCGVPTLKTVYALKKSALAFDSCNNRFYYYNPKTTAWSVVGSSSFDSTSLSNRINQKIDSLKRSNDSVFAYINGTRYFQFKDSTGGGSGVVDGIDSVLAQNQVLTASRRIYLNKNFFTIRDSITTSSPTWLNVSPVGKIIEIGKSTSGRFVVSNPANENVQFKTQLSTTGKTVETKGIDISLNDTETDITLGDFFNSSTTSKVGISGLLYFGSNGGKKWLTNTSVYDSIAVFDGDTLKKAVKPTSTNIDTSNQFVNNITRISGKDSIIFYKGGNRFAIKDSVGTNPAPVGYYGAFQDNTTQTAASANTAYPVKLNTTDLSNGVSVVNDGSANPTIIKLANTGIYNIQFSLQLEKTGGNGNFIVDIWARKNGIDIPATTGKVVLTGSANASPIVAAWNYVFDLVAGDSLQLMWSTSNDNVVILASPAVSPHPAIPSAILTVTQQSGIMAGTGITAMNGLTGSAQTFAVDSSNSTFKITSTGTSHTFNIPDASTSGVTRGLISNTQYNTFNSKLGASDTVSLSNRINAKGYGINIGSSQINLAANTTYYFGLTTAAASTTAAIRRVYITQSGTIKSGHIYMRTTGATSTENWTLSIRLNNTTSTTFATLANNSTDKVFSNTGLNINVVAGDYFEIITTTPAWSSAAGNTIIYGTIFIQ
jgi:hypothetical protein